MKLHTRSWPSFSFIFGFAFIRLCVGNLNKVIEVEGMIKEKSVLQKVDVDDGAATQYFERFGKIGLNYFVGVDANDKEKTLIPYINCQKYNKWNCKAGEQCKKTVKCVLNDPRGSERLACMANFVLDKSLNASLSEGSIIEPSLMDCWPQEESQLTECKEQDKCVADVRKTGKTDRPSLFCCCRTHNCNHQMVFYGEEVMESTTTVSAIVNSSSLSDQSNGLHLFQLIIIFFSIILFVAIFGVFIFSMPKLRKKICKRSGATTKSFLPFYKGANDRRGQLKALLGDWKGKKFDERITLEDGQKVHKKNIKLQKMVSNGRFGQVYEAFVVGPNCLVAIKIVPDRHVSSWKNEMEIYAIRTLRTSKHIAEFYGGFPSESDFWLVFNFYENNSLSDLLRQNTLSIMQSVPIISSMLEGIAFLHEEIIRGPNQKPVIIHRDIKSKNILISAGMVARIADFGLAMKCQSRGVRQEKIHGQVGTFRYMSPEVLEGATDSSCTAFQQIDVYAAALVIWEVLSRTETNGDVEEYALPYEREVGHNPSISQMREIVFARRLRPTTRNSLDRNKHLKEIVGTMREMWVPEPDERITCSCARDRLLRIRDEVEAANI